MYICSGVKYDECNIKCEHWRKHESVNCCDEQSRFCKVVREMVKCLPVITKYY